MFMARKLKHLDRDTPMLLPPDLRDWLGAPTMFVIFACCVLPQIFLVWKMMPETAGRSLEEIERDHYGDR